MQPTTPPLLRLAGIVNRYPAVTALDGVHVSPFVLGSLPCLATIVALVAVSATPQLLRRHAPAALGKPYFEGD